MGKIPVHPIEHRKPPLIVELVGLAGAGKTTLLRALIESDDTFRVVSDLEIRTKEHIPIFVSHASFLLSLFRQRRECDGRFTWDDMKAMIYLETWPKRLRIMTTQNDQAVLLNHGPVFKLATLHAFGPERLKSNLFDQWWHTAFEQWAHTLDLIVWLNAPDKTLIERINSRSQRHAVKGKPVAEASEFLTRYQNSYEQVLTKLTTYGGPVPVRFDTTATPVERLVEEVRQFCGLKFAGARP